MRRAGIFFVLPVILFQILISTGCSGGREAYKAIPAVKGQMKPADENAEFKEPGFFIPGKDTGVITDIVADVFREPNTQSERVTQAIFNQPAGILETKDAWSRVKVVDGYTGWIKSKYIDRGYSSIKPGDYKFRLVVTTKTKKISSGLKGGVTLKEIVMGTELFSKNKTEGWYEVAMPGNGTGWISESGLIQLKVNEHIPVTSAEDFVTTANKFMGTEYLWGGVSPWGGIDCSGLVYICSRINGIDLPRDADQQFKCGEEVDIQGIKPGDLLFFSSNEDLKEISLVGIATSGNQFINASKSRGAVINSSLNEDYYKKRLVGIKRIFR